MACETADVEKSLDLLVHTPYGLDFTFLVHRPCDRNPLLQRELKGSSDRLDRIA